MSKVHVPLVIIGAGPAGLALGYQLQRQGTSFVILERGKTAGSSWRHMPDKLCTLTPGTANTLLPNEAWPWSNPATSSAKEYAEYLEHFAHKHHLPIKYQHEVYHITREEDGYRIDTEQGTLSCTQCVICSGYYSAPYLPEAIRNANTDIPIIHFHDYRNAQALQQQGLRKVLVVGKRLSAGQLIDELHAAGIDCEISARSAIRHAAPPALLNFMLRHIETLEGIRLSLGWRCKQAIDVPMASPGTRQRIVRGELRVRSDIESISPHSVNFIDGSTKSYDAILCATGFRPALGFLSEELQPPDINALRNNFEHPEAHGLFFLGFAQQVNFRSRFLRGIRQNAIGLARRFTKP